MVTGPGFREDSMYRQSGYSPTIIKPRSKRGIGIMEVLVAAMVLGNLYAAVSNLQKGNRDALLRIRGRDGATEVAQNVIDKLGARGLASFTDAELKQDEEGRYWLKHFVDSEWQSWKDGDENEPDTIRISRTWMGQPGLVQNTMTVNYDVVVNVSQDNDYMAKAGSVLLGENCTVAGNCAAHVFAKRLDVKVSWPFKGATQSISVSGVIR